MPESGNTRAGRHSDQLGQSSSRPRPAHTFGNWLRFTPFTARLWRCVAPLVARAPQLLSVMLMLFFHSRSSSHSTSRVRVRALSRPVPVSRQTTKTSRWVTPTDVGVESSRREVSGPSLGELLSAAGIVNSLSVSADDHNHSSGVYQ